MRSLYWIFIATVTDKVFSALRALMERFLVFFLFPFIVMTISCGPRAKRKSQTTKTHSHSHDDEVTWKFSSGATSSISTATTKTESILSAQHFDQSRKRKSFFSLRRIYQRRENRLWNHPKTYINNLWKIYTAAQHNNVTWEANNLSRGFLLSHSGLINWPKKQTFILDGMSRGTLEDDRHTRRRRRKKNY